MEDLLLFILDKLEVADSLLVIFLTAIIIVAKIPIAKLSEKAKILLIKLLAAGMFLSLAYSIGIRLVDLLV